MKFSFEVHDREIPKLLADLLEMIRIRACAHKQTPPSEDDLLKSPASIAPSSSLATQLSHTPHHGHRH